MSAERLAPLLRALQSRLGSGPRLGLTGVRRALAELGGPERRLEVVHVAGTNGKGSVCAMLEAVALEAGLRTGLYTSPHLCRFNERIRIAGRPIEDEPFAQALRAALDPRLPELTFFETMTVAGFEAMRRADVDLVILEVGLGGRLDATNVIASPRATAITTIAADHEQLLGSDLASIASEKAGIVKTGAPLVVGPVEPRAWRAIQRVVARTGAGPVWRVAWPAPAGEQPGTPQRGLPTDDSALLRGSPRCIPTPQLRVSTTPTGSLTVAGPAGKTWSGTVGLAGRHQMANAALCVGLVWLLEARWPELARGLDRGLAAVRWPGRLERIDRDGVTLWLDSAHNPAGAAALAGSLRDRCTPCRTTLVFGAMADKNWPDMLALLAPLANRRLYTEPLRPVAGRRAADPRALAARAPGRWIGEPGVTLRHALAEALPGETIVVAGSVFLVGAVRAALLGLRPDPVLPL